MEIYWFAVFLGVVAGITNRLFNNPAFSVAGIMTTLAIVVPGWVIYYCILG